MYFIQSIIVKIIISQKMIIIIVTAVETSNLTYNRELSNIIEKNELRKMDEEFRMDAVGPNGHGGSFP
jgi:hypothetical protein